MRAADRDRSLAHAPLAAGRSYLESVGASFKGGKKMFRCAP